MNRLASWAGIFGGAACWYTAHDLGLYFSAYNCKQPWLDPIIQLITFIGALFCTWLSYQAKTAETADGKQSFTIHINIAAGSLFALVILWQGIGTLIYHGCAR